MKINNKDVSPTKNVNKQQIDAANNFLMIPDQIHKVPDNIRRALKVGKYRKPTKQKNQQLAQQSEGYLSNSQLAKDREKFGGNLYVRQIFSFLPKKNDNQEQQIQRKTQQDAQSPINIYSMVKSQTNKGKLNKDRVLYVKKKLSPLKKGLSIQPRSIPQRDKKSLKVTFLNIEKLELIKLYQNSDGKDLQQNQKTMSMTSSMLTHSNKNEYAVNNFLQSTTFSSKTPLFRKSISDGSPKKKLKPFSAPFDRYYYRDFIWKMAFNHNIFHQSPECYQKKFKVYIGKGNNSLLIKSLFKRRKSWWVFTQKIDQANFIWTQIKNNHIFASQSNKNSFYMQTDEDLQINKNSETYEQHSNLISDKDYELWINYFTKNRRFEDSLDQSMKKRNKHLGKFKNLQKINPRSHKVHNHLPNNYIIGNKKALFYTMSQYYENKSQNVFQYLPLTFHIQNGLQDGQYLKFLNSFYDRAKKIRNKNKAKNSQNLNNSCNDINVYQQKSVKNMWIVKPGQFTNRGNGITVCLTLQQIKKILKKKERHDNGNLKTYIIQSYLQRPFLYQRRKFDIRHFIMMSSINGIIKGYWYEKGYIRTTSFEYSIQNNFTNVHLTNDAVQKYLPQYGKYQKGNKVSYEEFQKYLNKQYGNRYNFYAQIYPKLKLIATDAMRACSLMIDPQKKGHNFQIFGLDYMIDSDFHPWLIEINNNPCLEVSCPLLSQIIPSMVENAFKICVDPLFPPPMKFQEKIPKFNGNYWVENKFQVVYDSSLQQQKMLQIFEGKMKLQLDYKQLQKDQDEIFEDDGNQLED